MDTATQYQRTEKDEKRNYGTASLNKSLIRCFNFARYWAGKIACSITHIVIFGITAHVLCGDLQPKFHVLNGYVMLCFINNCAKLD